MFSGPLIELVFCGPVDSISLARGYLGISGADMRCKLILRNDGRSRCVGGSVTAAAERISSRELSVHIAAMAYNFGSMTFATTEITNGIESPIVVGDRMARMVATKLTNAQNAPGAADWLFDSKRGSVRGDGEILACIASRSSELSMDSIGPRRRTVLECCWMRA
jgi:hypothetical protein